MARKSRKNMMPQAAVQEAVQQNEKELLRTAAYARLSVENGGHETEDSLHTQILQIHNYIRENPELTLTDTYADNGFTGTRFDRPEFERMMQDVRTGKIQCIVVKDLSRFGRDYIETGSYLETIFPMLHVRFIAINDDFDNIRQSDVDSLAVPIKNMVNSLYAKDISKKISLSYQMRREKGIPTSWCTPYGYQLNQQGNKLEATEDAKWVKLIYQWYLAGVSTNEIARRLEFLEVARPNERLNRKLHEGDDPTYNKWHPSTVLRILNSSAYIGELVSGKTQTASYKGIGLHPVEKKEWHIVENAHEAIILKSDFEKVQARREQNKEKREMAMARSKATREKCYNHLSGMVYCGCCRRNMTFERRVHGTVKETHYGVFICKRKKNTTPCAYHAVPEKMLMMVAMDQIHHLVSTMCEEEKLVKDMMRSSNLDSARSIKMKENSILFRIQEAEERRLRLYEDYKAEILDEDEYSQLKEHYIAEKQRLEHELQKQRQRALELEKRIKICDAQMERMRGILNQNEFDEELVHGGKSCMAGFVLKNTLSDNGGVTRGICKMDEQNNLTEVVETKNIVKTTTGAEADGVVVDVNSLVSMNMWGLTPDFLDVLEEGFKEFFEKEVPSNPLKAEYLIPIFIGELLEQGKMSVKVLKTNDTWYGMTYHEDVAAVKNSFKKMLENGVYKADLFSDL